MQQRIDDLLFNVLLHFILADLDHYEIKNTVCEQLDKIPIGIVHLMYCDIFPCLGSPRLS